MPPIFPATGRQRQNALEFQVGLGYIKRLVKQRKIRRVGVWIKELRRKTILRKKGVDFILLTVWLVLVKSCLVKNGL